MGLRERRMLTKGECQGYLEGVMYACWCGVGWGGVRHGWCTHGVVCKMWDTTDCNDSTAMNKRKGAGWEVVFVRSLMLSYSP